MRKIRLSYGSCKRQLCLNTKQDDRGGGGMQVRRMSIIKAGNKQGEDIILKITIHHRYFKIKQNESNSCMKNQPDSRVNYLNCLKCVLNATKQVRPCIWLYWLQFTVCDAHAAAAVSIWLDPASAVVWQRLPRFTAEQTSRGKTNTDTLLEQVLVWPLCPCKHSWKASRKPICRKFTSYWMFNCVLLFFCLLCNLENKCLFYTADDGMTIDRQPIVLSQQVHKTKNK